MEKPLKTMKNAVLEGFFCKCHLLFVLGKDPFHGR